MRKLEEYRQQASECRKLARQMLLDDQRDQLLAMAETWERLATERETMIRSEEDFRRRPEKPFIGKVPHP
jgi:hypothetical protein